MTIYPKIHPRHAQITPCDTPQPTNLLHSLLFAMPCTIIPHVPIDSEWAEILVGLRLNIPNKWWPGFSDGGINRGKIAAINLDYRDDDDDDDNKGDDGNNKDDDDGDDYIEAVATTEKKRKKGKSSTSKKQHKSKGMSNTPINHDSVMLSGKGDADFEGDADGEDSDDDIDLFEEKRYEKTKAKNWTKHKNGQPGREICLIPFTGPAEFFRPNLSDDEVKGMMDEHGNIRFHKIFE
jgi:hypothetical protein